jgi:ankyrin repeat protein
MNARSLFQFGLIFLISVISGETALMCSSNLDVTRFLVESGANLEAKNNRYDTPIASCFKSRALFQFVLTFLTSVIRGQTVLMMNFNLEVTRFLVERGADLEAKDDEYDTPII